MKAEGMLQQVRGKLIVSCQSYEGEALYDPQDTLMGRMAKAAQAGGAAGIRANTVSDIQDVRRRCTLPILGIIKAKYPDSDVYITPTLQEVEALVACGCQMIAMDATDRLRPGGVGLAEFFAACRARFPQQCFMADCSTAQEGLAAARLGFDCVGTTMAGYTPYTSHRTPPDFDMLAQLTGQAGVPVIAEGGIWTPQQLQRAFEHGAWAAVVGNAITNPQAITRRFVAAIE